MCILSGSFMCRSLSIRNVPLDLGDLRHSPLTHLAFWTSASPLGRYRALSDLDITRLSALTALKSLELEGWSDWETLTPLRALSSLEVLSCSCRHRRIGCTEALKRLADALLELPRLASIQYRYMWCFPRPTSGNPELRKIRPSIIEFIASLHPDQWRQQNDQWGLLLIRRIRG